MKYFLGRSFFSVCLAAWALGPGGLAAQTTYLHCGNLIDVRQGNVQKEMTLVVRADTISDVLNGYRTPDEPDARIIDLKNHTVMPGLIDLHVHLERRYDEKYYLRQFTQNEADRAFMAAENAKKTLLAGFTTVRDLGGSGVNTSLRNAIAKGQVPGPRIYSAGRILSSTGGHGDPTNGWSRDLCGHATPEIGVVNGPDECRKGVRQQYKDGADCIKITATGGVLSDAEDGAGPQFTLEEIQEICRTARDYGLPVAAHAHGDEGIQRAILGRVTTIEHGTFMSPASMELMKKHKVYLVPTISAGMEITRRASIPGYYPPHVARKALIIGPKLSGTFAKALKAGVPIAFGSDAGVMEHGENGLEFKYMVEAGMDPMEAIRTATQTNAELLGNQEIGVLAPGYKADIIAVPGNPLKEIELMSRVGFVMKGGEVYKMAP